MPFYKDPNNGLHWLDDADVKEWLKVLPEGSVEITKEEHAEILGLNEQNRISVPPSVLKAPQFRMALTRLKLRDLVENTVAAGSWDLKDWYEYSIAVRRDDEQLTVLCSTANIDNDKLDEIFLLGSTL